MIGAFLIKRQVCYCSMKIVALSSISAMNTQISSILVSIRHNKVGKEYKYCDIKVKIFRFLNKFLHEALFLEFLIILIIFFCNRYIWVLYGELPQNIMPYVISEWT
jgi:preprotein translocase subunit SecY